MHDSYEWWQLTGWRTPEEGWHETDDFHAWAKVHNEIIAWVYESSDAAGVKKTEPEVIQHIRRYFENRELKVRLELHAAQAVAEAFEGPAVARVSGRAHGWRGQTLSVAALNSDHTCQRLMIRIADPDDREEIQLGMLVDLACSFENGRLHLSRIISAEACDEPMPELPELPDPKPGDGPGADGRLPTMAELDKASNSAWGTLNHSTYRATSPWHLTTSPKHRAKCFDGRAAAVQAILREVAEAEGLQVIAVAAEADHIHLLGVPEGIGGMPPTWTWSRWIGRWKALTSKKLKDIPGLEEFEWQTGYALTAVSGGKQGAEDALAIVRRYVEGQGEQGDHTGSQDGQEGAQADAGL